MKPIVFLGLAAIFLVAKGFLASSLLNVDEFASYSIGLLWSQIGVILLSFGSITKVQLETTANLENNNKVAVSEDFSKSFSLIILNFFLLSLVVLTVYYFDKEFLAPSLIGLFVGVLQSLFLLFTTLTKSKQDFSFYGTVSLFKALLAISFVSFFGFFAPNYISLFVAEILALSFILILVLKREFFSTGISLALKKLNTSWYKEFLSLFLVSLSAVAFSSFDRLIGISKLGIDGIATLGFVALFYSAALMFQSTINSIVFPYMTKINLSLGKLSLIKFSVSLSLGIFSLLMLLILVVNYIFGEFFVTSFEKYSISFEMTLLLAFATAFKASDFLSNIFLILKKENLITLLRTTLVAFACLFLFIYGSEVIDYVAAVCLLIFLYTLVLFVSLWRIYESHT
jgi:O-antigen/teichoic acid export membrane protein